VCLKKRPKFGTCTGTIVSGLVLEAWPWPRGSLRTPFGGLDLGLGLGWPGIGLGFGLGNAGLGLGAGVEVKVLASALD